MQVCGAWQGLLCTDTRLGFFSVVCAVENENDFIECSRLV